MTPLAASAASRVHLGLSAPTAAGRLTANPWLVLAAIAVAWVLIWVSLRLSDRVTTRPRRVPTAPAHSPVAGAGSDPSGFREGRASNV